MVISKAVEIQGQDESYTLNRSQQWSHRDGDIAANTWRESCRICLEEVFSSKIILHTSFGHLLIHGTVPSPLCKMMKVVSKYGSFILGWALHWAHYLYRLIWTFIKIILWSKWNLEKYLTQSTLTTQQWQ